MCAVVRAEGGRAERWIAFVRTCTGIRLLAWIVGAVSSSVVEGGVALEIVA